MENLWTRNDRPIPAAYHVAAAAGTVVVVFCYFTAYWVPDFVQDWATWVTPPFYAFGPGIVALAGGALGLVVGSAPWLALRWPTAAMAVAAVPLVPTVLDAAPLHFGVFASFCAVAVTAGWRQARAAAVSAGLASVTITVWLVSEAPMAAPLRADIDQVFMNGAGELVTFLVYLGAVALVLVGAWGLRVSVERELQRRALTARSGEVEEQSAVVQERARLARDLHDVVAHHVSLIAVRAETAPYTHPDLSSDARTVLGDIAADARLALDELRGVLGILGRSGAAERAPQPTWSDITALVERSRSAGVNVEVVGDATAEVGPSAGYAAYRVVQEALTNARKHAPGARVTLDLDATSQLLTVLVSTPLEETTAASGGVGQGLVGMRERVEALGGRLRAGPVGDDFVVEAILPRAAA
jgi:signal transduction histidine kinase